MKLREAASIILTIFMLGGTPVIDIHSTVPDVRDFRIATTEVTQPLVGNPWLPTSTVLQVGDHWVWEHEWWQYPTYEFWENTEGPDLWLGGDILAVECGRPWPNACTVEIIDLRNPTVVVENQTWSTVKKLYK